MNHRLNPRVALCIGALGLAVGVASGACGGGSGNTVPVDDGGSSGGSSGSSGGSTSSSGSTSSGGSGSSGGSTSSSGSTSSGGSGSSGGSTSSSGSTSSGGSGSGGGSGSSSGGEGGTGQTSTWATKITVPVGWPTTSTVNSGTGNIVIWFLGIQNLQADGTTYTGTTRSCKTSLPDITLSALAQIVTGGTKVQIAITDTTFNAITRTFSIGGTQGAPGGMTTQSPSLGGLGLATGSQYLMLPTPTVWPPDCAMSATTCNSVGSFAMADLQDDDHDNSQGITATPQMGNGYVLPPTSTSLPLTQADKVYIVLRQEIDLSGTRSADGKTSSGTAKLSLFDNHVVGCHISGGGDCTSTQASFIDAARTKYTTQANIMQSSPPPISPTNSVSGTFTMQQINNGDSCDAVRAALP